ncbi:NAD-dependent succinate-semialdehyde dehydrogenase [Arthrobacter sp. MI7-26]|uniref:NAD-dependent succinate-semialdehyde dehydrogenase n=1 Tax=Arthrobacter sp. MI7-26 TaxID=2993653 RepID=UPI002248E129|nr:NAD-dependent succinate-semialdehyde dehydrogenase [Arthrobacter sp. MI7-26]MCX2748068.1 NAD-dependent succinate-semialdehyde dehydrogenase [Arthrobacter sp. MI7-26]
MMQQHSWEASPPHNDQGVAAAHLKLVPTNLLIDGIWRAASTGATFAVHDPSTEKILTRVADADASDALAAMDAADRAQRDWAATPSRERSEILRRAFELVNERREHLAALITLEMGKPLTESRGEVAYGAEFLRWYASEADRVTGRFSASPDGGSRLLVRRKPVGPCLLITPWNFPLAMATRKIAPAIAAGCTMVLKPAELTPLTALAFASILMEAGLPPGVLNLITSTDPGAVTDPLLTDPRLRKVSFTGSTRVGRHLLSRASEQVLRTSMELGGNAPFIVFEDADIDTAVAGAMTAKLRNMGEACTAANRFLVHESVAERFSESLAARMAAAIIGPGLDPDTTIGPMIDERSRAKVASLVDDAMAKGARALTGGVVPNGPGHFYPPTVLVDIHRSARILREEIFGPVAPIQTFRTDSEAVTLANDTEYGLAAYVFTRDLERALRVGEALETGMLGVNLGAISNPAAPFGGVKQSGLGREGGSEGIDEYLTVQYTGIA